MTNHTITLNTKQLLPRNIILGISVCTDKFKRLNINNQLLKIRKMVYEVDLRLPLSIKWMIKYTTYLCYEINEHIIKTLGRNSTCKYLKYKNYMTVTKYTIFPLYPCTQQVKDFFSSRSATCVTWCSYLLANTANLIVLIISATPSWGVTQVRVAS